MGLLNVQSTTVEVYYFILRSLDSSKQQSWARVIMAVSPRSKLICTRNVFLMDVDKDGTLSKSDLRAAFDNVGKLMDEGELDGMLGEVGGGCNFDNMVKMFQEKMAGGSNDPDDLIVRAFKAYEVDGKIEPEMFRHALMNFGDKFNKAEVDDIFGEFEVDDDGFIASKDVIGLFVAGGGEEKKEEAPAPVEEAAPEAPAEDAGGDDGAKKKKKKKKAAK